MVETAVVGGVLFRQRSSAYPPVLVRNSTGFYTGVFSKNPQQIREFSSGYAHDFRADYQQRVRDHFHQLFRLLSTQKKGEKQAEWRICGKGSSGGGNHKE
jgi:hypothetical protein